MHHSLLILLIITIIILGSSSLRCFLASGTQGVSYARGTWHHPLLVLLPEQDFLVVDRGGRGDNLVEQDLDQSVLISLG